MDFEFFGFGKKKEEPKKKDAAPKKQAGKTAPKKEAPAAQKNAGKKGKTAAAPPAKVSQTPEKTQKTKAKGKKDVYTTVMLRNIPNKYTREMLVGELDAQGFQGKYVFLFLPTDFVNGANPGYCFVDFRTNNARRDFESKFQGKSVQDVLPAFKSHKVCEVSRAKHQGLEENLENLRSSDDLMRRLATRPQCTPLVYDDDGREIKFETPAPRPEDEAAMKRTRNKSQTGSSASPASGRKRASANTRTTQSTAKSGKSAQYSAKGSQKNKNQLKNTSAQGFNNQNFNAYTKAANWYYGNYATQQYYDKTTGAPDKTAKSGKKAGKGVSKGAPNVAGKKVRSLSLSAGVPQPQYPMKLEQAYMCAYRDWMASTMASYMNSPAPPSGWGSSWNTPPPAPGLSSWGY